MMVAAIIIVNGVPLDEGVTRLVLHDLLLGICRYGYDVIHRRYRSRSRSRSADVNRDVVDRHVDRVTIMHASFVFAVVRHHVE